MYYYRSHLVFNCCFYDGDVSHGSVATHSKHGEMYKFTIYNFCDLNTKIILEIDYYFDEVIRRTKMMLIFYPLCIHRQYY